MPVARVLIVARDEPWPAPLPRASIGLAGARSPRAGPMPALAARRHGDRGGHRRRTSRPARRSHARPPAEGRLRAAPSAGDAIGDPEPPRRRRLRPDARPAAASGAGGDAAGKLVRMAIAEEEFELRLETFAERGRRLDLPEQTASASERAGRRRARAAVPGPLQRAGRDRGPRWSAPSPPTPPSTICMSAPSTPWCCGPARTRPRRCRSPPACGATPGSITSRPCSICEPGRHRPRRGLPSRRFRPRHAGDAGADTAKRVHRAGRAPIAARTPSARRWKRRAAPGLMDASDRPLHPRPVRRPPGAPGQRRRAAQPAAVGLRAEGRRPAGAGQVARDGGWLDRAIPQIGSMIGRLVRAEDTAARLGPEVFALALPATHQAAARAAGERIAAVIGCTAFEAGESRPPFVVEFDIGVAEVEPGENAAHALERAAQAVAGPAARADSGRLPTAASRSATAPARRKTELLDKVVSRKPSTAPGRRFVIVLRGDSWRARWFKTHAGDGRRGPQSASPRPPAPRSPVRSGSSAAPSRASGVSHSPLITTFWSGRSARCWRSSG